MSEAFKRAFSGAKNAIANMEHAHTLALAKLKRHVLMRTKAIRYLNSLSPSRERTAMLHILDATEHGEQLSADDIINTMRSLGEAMERAGVTFDQCVAAMRGDQHQPAGGSVEVSGSGYYGGIAEYFENVVLERARSMPFLIRRPDEPREVTAREVDEPEMWDYRLCDGPNDGRLVRFPADEHDIYVVGRVPSMTAACSTRLSTGWKCAHHYVVDESRSPGPKSAFMEWVGMVEQEVHVDPL